MVDMGQMSDGRMPDTLYTLSSPSEPTTQLEAIKTIGSTTDIHVFVVSVNLFLMLSLERATWKISVC